MTNKLTVNQTKALKSKKRLDGHNIKDLSFKDNWVLCLCEVKTTVSGYSDHIREVKGLPPQTFRAAPAGLAWGLTGLVLREYNYE